MSRSAQSAGSQAFLFWDFSSQEGDYTSPEDSQDFPQENISPLTASHGEGILEGFHSFVSAFIPQHEKGNQAKASHKKSDSGYFVTLQIIKQTTETLLGLRNNHGAASIRLLQAARKRKLALL